MAIARFQILANKKQEKIFTVNGEMKKSFMDGLLGKEKRELEDNS